MTPQPDLLNCLPAQAFVVLLFAIWLVASFWPWVRDADLDRSGVCDFCEDACPDACRRCGR